MIPIRYTRNLFLRTICVVYLFAFISFYVQIPGLYGDNGILPASSLLENSKHKTLSAKVHYQPTLLWLAPYLGLNINYALDLLALLGSFLAFTGFVSQKFCTIPLFAGLWSLYFSLNQIGQVFVKTQWDDLLLEAGFLCLFVAPLLPGKRRGSKGSPSDNVSFWLVRWLFFRLTFTAGLTKFLTTSKWWNLTAFSYLFETMVLPSPLSWYAFHLPMWFLRLTAVFVQVSELVLPLLFLFPVRSVRITGFVFQILLQICVVLTGNFSFANLLIVTLSLSLLDDRFFFTKLRKPEEKYWNWFENVVNLLVHSAILYGVIVLYRVRYNGQFIDAEITFTKQELNAIVSQYLLITVFWGLASLGLTVARAVATSLLDTHGTITKLKTLLATVFYSSIAVLIFIASVVPLSSVHPSTNATIASASMRNVYNRIHKLHAVNQYDLAAKLIDNEGRQEIVLEGSDNVEGPWLEYNFLYKPGNVNHSLPFVAPYSPRLDWQLWWATKSTYQEQPWLLSLTHRLLHGTPEVLDLLDRSHSPFAKKPPKFVRAVLYNYKYTAWSERWQSSWWKREKKSEYFPAFSKDSATLNDYLKARNLLPPMAKQSVNPVWKQILDGIRFVTNHLEATLLLWSVFTAGCAIISTTTKSK